MCGKDLVLPIDAFSASNYLKLSQRYERLLRRDKSQYNAMKWAHNFVPGMTAYNDPLDERIVKRVLESALRAVQPNRNPKTPLSKDIIDRLFIQVQKSSDLVEIRNAVVIALAFALLLRHDEISHLSCAHLEKVGKNVKVRILSSKTDSLKNGRDMWLAEGRTSRLLDCYLARANLRFGRLRIEKKTAARIPTKFVESVAKTIRMQRTKFQPSSSNSL